MGERMRLLCRYWSDVNGLLERVLTAFQGPVALLGRCYVAQAFWASGLTKLRDWDTTLFLFREEYQVPLLSPVLAAYLGTAGELLLPVLLVLGVGGRIGALGLSVVNVVAVLSLAEVAPAALQQHISWGSILLALAVFGYGPWTLQSWWQRKSP